MISLNVIALNESFISLALIQAFSTPVGKPYKVLFSVRFFYYFDVYCESLTLESVLHDAYERGMICAA